MRHDNKKSLGLCYVVEDKEIDSFNIKVIPVSYIPDTKIELNKNIPISFNVVDMDSFYNSINITKSDHIEATWLPEGEQNRVTAPDVCKGDIVEVWTVDGTDENYWTVYAHNQSLRKHEKVLFWFSNKSSIGNDSTNAYYFLVDTYGKLIHFHTSTNDGEAAGYDMVFNTLIGQFFLKDTFDNKIDLNSPRGALETTVMKEYTVNSPKVTFNCDELLFNAGTTVYTGGSISHNGIDIGDSHNHPQTDGNHHGGDTNTKSPNPL